jgi:asparagine synthase (glutamine-hydrolysing)
MRGNGSVCGIAGFLNFRHHRSLALAANVLQKHRGPDAQGCWSAPELSLSHQRLSIIDLSERSNQPFVKDGLVIVFNGEIYNYRELRDDLAREQVSFVTTSDTEVVLEAYRRHGIQCLDILRGMFAFAIWSEAEGTLFLARDHFGIKPIYYYARGGQFAFASELKTLSQLMATDRQVSAAGLAALLTYQWLPVDFCILDEFQSLPPAHYALVRRDGSFQTKCYWRLPAADPLAGSEADTIEELAAALEDTVKHHLVADVGVGAFLSGGLDSSLICALAARGGGPLRTFTIATDRQAKQIERMPSDELFARKMADTLKTEHEEITIRSDVIRDLPDMLSILDEPIGDPAAINVHLICAGARKAGVKVLLSGMGADELFFGYRRQKAWLYAQRYQNLPAAARFCIDRAVEYLPVRVGRRGLRSVRWAKRFLSFASLGAAERYQSSFSYYSEGQLQSLLQPEWRAAVKSVREDFLGVFEERFGGDQINRLCFTDLNLFLPGLNLAYTDRASMAASTEVRVPFVDKRLVELAMRIPGPLKMRKGHGKYVLKRAAERYLPKEIAYRPKASFGMPLRAWISYDLRPMVDDLLSYDRIKRRGWINPVICHKMIQADRRGRSDFSYQIFQLLILELWAQAVLDVPLQKAA